ncbi:MAG: MarR family transcriptional regulator [Candidatus Hodarchaeales archaeon]
MSELHAFNNTVKLSPSEQERNRRLVKLFKLCDTVKECDVITYLHDHGPVTRKEVVVGTGIKWTTAHDCLTRLHIKLLVKREIIPFGQGRPTVFWSLEE